STAGSSRRSPSMTSCLRSRPRNPRPRATQSDIISLLSFLHNQHSEHPTDLGSRSTRLERLARDAAIVFDGLVERLLGFLALLGGDLLAPGAPELLDRADAP